MLRWIGTNLRTLGLAFILALAVWISAVVAADPDIEETYPLSIPLEIIGQNSGLVVTGNYPQQVDVRLLAPTSVWERLNNDATTIRAWLDLSGLDAGFHTLPVQVQIEERPVRLVYVSPENITLTLEPLITQTMPVDLVMTGEPAVGFQAGSPTLAPTEISVSGPQSLVQSIDRIRLDVKMEGVRENIDQDYTVQAVGQNNRAISGVTLSPTSVHVTIPVSQQGGYRDVAVKVVVQGQVASGYRLTSISVFPPVVTLFSADPQLVNALPGFVETAPLDLSDANSDLITRLALTLDEGISVVGEQSVLVEVAIDAIQGSLTLSEQPIEVIGLGEGLGAEISPPSVDVILSGPLPLLEVLTIQDVRVIIDATGLAAGTYQLTPKVEILTAEITVETILPATVQVVIGTATATPSPIPTP